MHSIMMLPLKSIIQGNFNSCYAKNNSMSIIPQLHLVLASGKQAINQAITTKKYEGSASHHSMNDA